MGQKYMMFLSATNLSFQRWLMPVFFSNFIPNSQSYSMFTARISQLIFSHHKLLWSVTPRSSGCSPWEEWARPLPRPFVQDNTPFILWFHINKHITFTFKIAPILWGFTKAADERRNLVHAEILGGTGRDQLDKVCALKRSLSQKEARVKPLFVYRAAIGEKKLRPSRPRFPVSIDPSTNIASRFYSLFFKRVEPSVSKKNSCIRPDCILLHLSIWITLCNNPRLEITSPSLFNINCSLRNIQVDVVISIIWVLSQPKYRRRNHIYFFNLLKWIEREKKIVSMWKSL